MAVVPAFLEASPMGFPAVSAKDMHELRMPEKVATSIPFAKLNSAMAFCFLAAGSSFSLASPAMAARRMPNRQTPTPPRVINPGAELTMSFKLDAAGMEGKSVLAAGGTSVPNAAQ